MDTLRDLTFLLSIKRETFARILEVLHSDWINSGINSLFAIILTIFANLTFTNGLIKKKLNHEVLKIVINGDLFLQISKEIVPDLATDKIDFFI